MANNICKILGENIKHYRKTRGLKQDQLAELIGLEIKSLSLIETGKGFVSAKTLEKLSNVLNVPVSDLFAEENNNNSEILFSSIMENMNLIRNNSGKLQTINIVLKSLI